MRQATVRSIMAEALLDHWGAAWELREACGFAAFPLSRRGDL
jgi:hypothetical protein